MKKYRIVEKEFPDGRKSYVVQERHFLFKWWWVDAWMNHDVSMKDDFDTLYEAEELVHWLSTPVKIRIIK